VSTLRRVAREVLPPAAIQAARWIGSFADRGEWRYLPGGWPASPGVGWNADSIVKTQLSRWAAFVDSIQEPRALGLSAESGRASAPDLGFHNTAMTFGYVLARCGIDRDRTSILDWGGGLGQYAVLAKSLAPDLALDYHCRDLPDFAREGRNLQPDVIFHDNDADAFARTYDLVMASSSLQYVQDWRSTLGSLVNAAGRYLYVTRQPFVDRAKSFVILQRPSRHGYATEYPGWVLNRDEFLSAVTERGLILRREFLIWESPYVPRAPERPQYRGFLFSRPEAAT
jgi:putative methyltransferase (TIGR04325 family)